MSAPVERHWTGIVRPDQVTHYADHLEEDILPKLGELPGFVAARVLTRELDDGLEFRVITVWESREHIRAFTGDDISVAVVADVAKAMMIAFDATATHYDVGLVANLVADADP